LISFCLIEWGRLFTFPFHCFACFPSQVHHVLNHTSGLHNALANIIKELPLLLTDWDECLQRIALSAPETEPGQEQLYHYLSFGWLCGGIVEVQISFVYFIHI